MDDGFLLIGDLLESCRYSAKKDWRDDWAKGTPLDELLCAHVRRIKLEFVEYPAGRVEVTVHISAKSSNCSEAFFYKFLRSSGRYYQMGGA